MFATWRSCLHQTGIALRLGLRSTYGKDSVLYDFDVLQLASSPQRLLLRDFQFSQRVEKLLCRCRILFLLVRKNEASVGTDRDPAFTSSKDPLRISLSAREPGRSLTFASLTNTAPIIKRSDCSWRRCRIVHFLPLGLGGPAHSTDLSEEWRHASASGVSRRRCCVFCP